MIYGEVLKYILSYQNTGVMYKWNGDDSWEELPPSKSGYDANLASFILEFHFEIKQKTKNLPRKQKKRLKHHFNKKVKRLRKEFKK